jgi:hypothetical protein
MEKCAMTMFLILTLSACIELAPEKEGNRSGQNLLQNTAEWIRGVFKRKPAEEEDVRKNKMNKTGPVQKTPAMAAIQNHLSQVTANAGPASQIQDQKIEMEDKERYRRDYEDAIDLTDKIEALAALVQADQKNAIPLLKQAYASREPELRKAAVLHMHAFHGNKEAVDILLKALDDLDPDVVMEAVEGLAGLENKRVIKKLKKVAESHADVLVREVAQDYVNQMQTN